MSLWPTTFAKRTEPLGSPLPSIWLIGESKTGKSSFMAMTKAQKPLIIDTEGSWATLKYQLPPEGRVIDLSPLALAEKGESITLNKFSAFWKVINEIEVGKYDLIGIDGAEYLFEGSMQWLKTNEKVMGKHQGAFAGKEGTIYAWGDAKNQLWPHIIKMLESKSETVILATHPKAEFDKTSKTRTGKQTSKGADFTELVTLKLWLFSPEQTDPNGNKPGTASHIGRYWALAKKHRLTWFVMQENGFPIQKPILPLKLILEEGKGYPEMIWNYMNQPSPDYGDLNQVVGDPTYDEADKLAQQAELENQLLETRQQQMELQIQEAMNEIVREYVGEGRLYDTISAVKERVLSEGYSSFKEMAAQIGVEAAALTLKEKVKKNGTAKAK
jgi:hypothetical protein